MNYIIWKGESRLREGSVIQAVLTPTSSNAKTGNIPQLWILPAETKPTTAVKSGEDASVCGDCPLRRGICYVNTVVMGPDAVFKSKKQDVGRRVLALPTQTRLGAWGDPAALPRSIYDIFTNSRNLGYTRQWKHEHGDGFQDICMASVFTPEEREQAKAKGFRTYRIGNDVMVGEKLCPYPKVTCAQCGWCNGSRGRKFDIVIPVHGVEHKKKNFEILLKEK